MMCANSYLPNPNAGAMGILALAASKQEQPAVKSLVLKYLSMETSVGLDSTVS